MGGPYGSPHTPSTFGPPRQSRDGPLYCGGMPIHEVPVIDVGPARRGGRPERAAVAAVIDGACREIGFFAISGHGVPDRLVDDMRRAAHEFFALPMADKLAAR